MLAGNLLGPTGAYSGHMLMPSGEISVISFATVNLCCQETPFQVPEDSWHPEMGENPFKLRDQVDS